MPKSKMSVPRPDDPTAWWNRLPKGKSGNGSDVCPHGVALTKRCVHCARIAWREKHDPTFYDDPQ